MKTIAEWNSKSCYRSQPKDRQSASRRTWLLYIYHTAGGGYFPCYAQISSQVGCQVLVCTNTTISRTYVYLLLPSQFLCSNSVCPYVDSLGKGWSTFTKNYHNFFPLSFLSTISEFQYSESWSIPWAQALRVGLRNGEEGSCWHRIPSYPYSSSDMARGRLSSSPR